MVRTTPDKVQTLLGRNYDKKLRPDVMQFVESASRVVDRLVVMAAQKDRVGVLPDGFLEDIEKWLAAHLYAQQDPLLSNKSTQGASGAFQTGTLGEGFASTQFGRTALDLDWTGCLKNINQSQYATAISLRGDC